MGVDNPDIRVLYDTQTDELFTDTQYDLPEDTLQVEVLVVPDAKAMSVVGSFSKKEDKFAKSNFYTNWTKEEEILTLYEKLVPNKRLVDYINFPISDNVVSNLRNALQKFDHRYGIMVDSIKSAKDLLQFLVDFRWRRFNLLDHYISFSDYIGVTTMTLTNVKLPSDFPVLLTKNTILHKSSVNTASEPYYVDTTSNAIVYTSDTYKATMKSGNTIVENQSLNRLNFSININNVDYLITNNRNYLTLKSTDSVKQLNFKYNVDMVTGIHYTGGKHIIYLITNYVEHAIIIDNDFNIEDDELIHILDPDLIKLIDPKTYVFRDRYQYYVNNDDGTFSTYPIVDMFNENNQLIKKNTIIPTTLKDPRPVSITDNGPRISAKYNSSQQLMYAYTESISLLTLYPAMGYTFDKYSFYNPRKYLVDSDYNEACIPLHGGFRRTELYPWLWYWNYNVGFFGSYFNYVDIGFNSYWLYNDYFYGDYWNYYNTYWSFF